AWTRGPSASFPLGACRPIERRTIRGVRREWTPEGAAATVSLDEILSNEQQAGSRERFLDRLATEQNVEGELLDGETHAAVRSAVESLPAPYRRPIERRYYQDRPVELPA